MRCAICGESIGNSEKQRWGPEFAHRPCVLAFNAGVIDEREECAKLCDELGEDHNTNGYGCAAAIRERSGRG